MPTANPEEPGEPTPRLSGLRSRYQARSPGMGPAITEELERTWEKSSRYDRRAEITRMQRLTPTGTLRILFRVVDDQPFSFKPGRFVGIEAKVPDLGYLRSPYCILSPPSEDRTFELLVRIVPEGPLSCHLATRRPGDVIDFRGPLGRSMVPKEPDTRLVLLATGVGVGPLLSLVSHLADEGFDRLITLYWGLRLAEDICLVDDLDALVARYPRFSYHISLSRPPEGWTGLRGRLSETVPPLLDRLSGTHFYLVGNGAMNREMAAVLSDLGVQKKLIYEEHFFNPKHVPDPRTLEAIRRRFVAHDLFSPLADEEAGSWLSWRGGLKPRESPVRPSGPAPR